MKSAKHWRRELGILELSDTYNAALNIIRAIQLDARKQGMTDAAEMVRRQGLHSDFHFRMSDAEELMANKIIEARDRLEPEGRKP